ncbi:MAG: poly-gamma-glutamate biosynthesis protein PgsC/CapC [Verrucomicrobiales bacterium]
MSPELLTAAIGIGLAISLLFSELFGLAAGGLVVPGYFALYLNHPIVIAMTVAAALATYLIVRLLLVLRHPLREAPHRLDDPGRLSAPHGI